MVIWHDFQNEAQFNLHWFQKKIANFNKLVLQCKCILIHIYTNVFLNLNGLYLFVY